MIWNRQSDPLGGSDVVVPSGHQAPELSAERRAELRVRRAVTVTLAFVGIGLFLLSRLARHGAGPIAPLWNDVAAGAGFLLQAPMFLVLYQCGGKNRKAHLIASVAFCVVGAVTTFDGIVALLR